MPIEITAVQGRRQLGEFIDLPFRLHAGTPWVTPLLVERRAFLSKRLNAFFKHGEAEYFLARRDGRVVGRITAQIDFAYNQFHGTRTGMFGFIEFEDDPEILRALLGTAEAWLVARGCEQMLGPMDFSLNEEGGVLIEGFELEPLVRQSWHPPYYQQRIEAEGLTKAMDLLSWKLSVDDRTKMKPVIEKLAKRCREKYGVTVRKMTRRSLRKDLDKFADVYNEAWSENWGFVPYSKADLDAYAFDLQLERTGSALALGLVMSMVAAITVGSATIASAASTAVAAPITTPTSTPASGGAKAAATGADSGGFQAPVVKPGGNQTSLAVTGGTAVAARVEIGPDGLVRVSAPDITNLEGAKPEALEAERERLTADLANGWDGVAPRPFDFDGDTFRKPGGIAPQMVWDKKTNQMVLELYIGANSALPVPLRPVPGFHDDPWPKG